MAEQKQRKPWQEMTYRKLDNKALIFNLTKRPTRRGINRAGYILSWIFRGEAPLDCWSSGKSGPFS